ncbi:MAG: TatD family hydrolase [Fibrobacter sp.]|nr:TatD family hydrolase [Fibrobacter sp.]
MFIDSHCHLDAYEEYSGEKLDDLFARLQAATDAARESQMRGDSVKDYAAFPIPDLSSQKSWSSSKSDAPDPNVRMPEAFIHVACDPKDLARGVELIEKYPFVYGAFGIHPEYVSDTTPEDEARVAELLKHPKCVACGEIGLDYHYGADKKSEQCKLFERQLDIGITSGKPLVFHLREADDDALAILRNAPLHEKNIHVHCFTGTPEFVEELLALDANVFIGFTGIVTFKSAQNVRDAAALVPYNQILLETDSPYMAPVPHRGKTCHSGFIPYTAQMLADIKKIPVEELYRQCRENTLNCYFI